ncbi:MAG: helix-turn-helix transcriptional regulator [Acidobacteriota bacterium]
MALPLDTGQVALVGQTLRRLRKRRGLSQDEMALRIGIGSADLVRMEKGRCRVALDTLISISQELGIGVWELFEDGENQANAPAAGHQRGRFRETRTGEVEEFVAFRRLRS